MQPGSLVECIKKCSGFCIVNGVQTKIAEEIEVGEIRTISRFIDDRWVYDSGMVKVFPNALIELVEDGTILHPECHLPTGRDKNSFREIQPPMKIIIEQFLPESTLA